MPKGPLVMNRPILKLGLVPLVCVFLAAGCQMPGPGPHGGPQPTPSAAQPAPEVDLSKAFLCLEEIEPPVPPPPQSTLQWYDPPMEALKHFLAGKAYLSDFRLREALEHLTEAERHDPRSPEVQLLLGRVLINTGDHDQAIEHLQRSIELDPGQMEAYYLLGRAALAKRDYEGGMLRLREALACAPQDPDHPIVALTHFYLAQTLQAQGYLTAAIQQYQAFQAWNAIHASEHEELTEINRRMAPKVPFWIGQAYAQLGQHHGAARAFAQAVEADPEAIEPRLAWVGALLKCGRTADALRAAQALVVDYPQRSEALELLEQVYDQQGQPERYVAELTALADAHPDRPALLLAVAQVLVQQDHRAQACSVLAELLEVDPQQQEARWRLVELYEAEGQFVAALETLAEAVAVDRQAFDRADEQWSAIFAKPEAQAQVRSALEELFGSRDRPAAFWYWLAEAFDQFGDQQKAEAGYKKALESDDRLGPAYLGLAKQALGRFAWSEAIERLQEARSAGLRGPRWHRLLGNAYDGLDDTDQALEHYQTAARQGDQAAILALAQLLERQGDLQAAKPTYLLLLQTDPDNAEAWEALTRLAIRMGQLGAARRHLKQLKRQVEEPGPAARCQALIDFYKSGDVDQYRQALSNWLDGHADDLKARMDLAEVLLAESEPHAAQQQLRKILAAEPGHVRARLLQVTLLARLLEFHQAVQLMQELLVQHPNRPNWLRQLVNLRVDFQQYDQAITIADRLLARRQGAERSRYDLAMKDLALAGAKRNDQRVEHLQGWMEAIPSDDYPRGRLVGLLDKMERHEQAITLTQQWLAEDPGDARRKVWLAQALTAAGRYDAAVDHLMSWLEAEPEQSEQQALLHQLGLTLAHARRAEQAVNFYKLWPGNEEEQVLASDAAVTACLAARQFGRAIDLIDELPQEQREMEYWRLRLIRVLGWAGRHEEAIWQAKSLVADLGPQDSQSWFLAMLIQSSCYQLAGRIQDAVRVLEELFERHPKSDQVCNDLGYTWADMGRNIEQAEQMIRLAVGVAPRNAAYLDSLGWVFYKQGRFDQAVEWLQRAVAADEGEEPLLHDHLGDAYYRLGELDKAEGTWRAALEIHDQQAEAIQPRFMEPGLADRLGAKLADLAAGRTPAVAPLAELQQPTTQPADLPLQRDH